MTWEPWRTNRHSYERWFMPVLWIVDAVARTRILIINRTTKGP